MKNLLLVALMLMAALNPAFAQPVEKEWTFLVFINADNNLDEYGVLDQEEMARVGTSDRLNIVTLIDRFHGPATMNLIEKGKVTPISEPIEVDMGDYRELVKFVETAIKQFPARKYCLTVWNHGAGWKQKGVAVKGISYDDQSGNHITTAQLGQALRDIQGLLGRKIDLFCMDACLMQMMEVAWEIRNSCSYLVASEETVPGDGFPYEQVLQVLKPGMGPLEFGAGIVREFKLCYQKDVSDGGPWDLDRGASAGFRVVKKTTLSLIDCARLKALKLALDGLAGELMRGAFTRQIAEALAETHKFSYSTNVDLWHFVYLLMAKVQAPEVKMSCQKVKDAFKDAILANGVTGDSDETWPEPDSDLRPTDGRFPIDAYGLAIYFPEEESDFSPAYLDLSYANESMWDELLHDHYLKLAAQKALDGLVRGNAESLRRYVAQARSTDGEYHRRLLLQANFRLFCEGPGEGFGAAFSPAFRHETTRLLSDLAARLK